MKFIVCIALLGLFVGPALSGVLTLTSQGLQYLNNEQFAALQDPYGTGAQQNQQGLWRDDGSGGSGGQSGGAAPQVQEYDDNESEQEDTDDEVEEPEEKGDDDESEEKDGADDEVQADDVPEVKGSKYTVKAKAPKRAKAHKKSHKKKVKVQESDEVADDDAEADDAEGGGKGRPPPPMPDVLKQEMEMGQYDSPGSQGYQGGGPGSQYQGGAPGSPGYQQPGGAPLLSRMTSFFGSLLGRGGVTSDPIYMNRNAKSISSEVEIEQPMESLSRTKRQMKLGGVQFQPFYHVRNNIRTMVRRQPNTKLAPTPIDDFNTLSEKESKPIKLFMEPYAAPATYQSPPLSPAQGVRAPPSSSGLNPGSGLGSSGLGQGSQQPSTSSNSGGKQGSSGGQKKNNNKQGGNKGGSEKDSEEDDSDENNSDQYPNYGEEDEDSSGLVSNENYDSGAEDDEYDDYEDNARK